MVVLKIPFLIRGERIKEKFEPTEQEAAFIGRFGNDRTKFVSVMEELHSVGLEGERLDNVLGAIRKLRRANLGQAGKERIG